MCDSVSCDPAACRCDLAIAATVALDGWDVVEIGGRRSRQRWAYTVGLSAYSHPELAMSGLEPGLAAGLLWLLAEQVASGIPIADGDLVDFGDWQFTAFPVARPTLLRRAEQFRRTACVGPDLRALQLVYPDIDGVWPWEPGCRLGLLDQPMPGMQAA